MKKLTAFILALTMLLALAVPIMAADATGPFKVGETYYSTLKDALTAVEENGTVYVTQTYEGDISTDTSDLGEKSVTLDLGGNKVTHTGIGINLTASKHLTIKNGKLEIKTNFYCYGGSKLTLDGVEITNDGGQVSTVTGVDTGYNVEIKNSILTHSADNAAILIKGNSKLDVVNSTITVNGDANAWGQSDGIIAVEKSGTATINFDSTSSVYLNRSNYVVNGTDTNSQKQEFINVNADPTAVNVTLANGFKVFIGTTRAAGVTMFEGAGVATKLNLQDNGTKYYIAIDRSPYCTINKVTLGNTEYNWTKTNTESVEGYYDLTVSKKDIAAQNTFEYTNESGTVTYASALSVAIANAKADSTIKLTESATISENALSISKDLTLDLNGNTLTVNYANNYFITSLTSNLTIKNGTLYVARGIVCQDGGNLTFNGVTYGTNPNATTGFGPLVKLSDGTANSLTVEKSTLTQAYHKESMILVEHNTKGTITLKDGAKLIKTTVSGAGAAGNATNGSIISVSTWNGSGNPAATNTVANIIVNSGATLVQDGIDNTNRKHFYADGAAMNLTLNSGSVLKFIGTATAKGEYFGGTAGKLTVTDNGASFVASATAIQAGVSLYSGSKSEVEGEKVLVYVDQDGKLYNPANVVQNTSANAELTFKAAFADTSSFALVNGAAIRIANDGTDGIRFRAVLSDALNDKLTELGNKVAFGMHIAQTDKLDDGTWDATDILDGKAGKIVDSADHEGFKDYRVALYGFTGTAASYQKEYSARGYILLMCENGNVEIYTAYNENNSRSLYKVAKLAQADYPNNATIAKIISTVDNAANA